MGIMAIVAAMLLERYGRGAAPLTLVSMDNCSHNGDLLKKSVLTIAKEWKKRGYAEEGFISYLQDPEKISFPWTMIDKDYRPDPEISIRISIQKELQAEGVEDMEIVVTDRRTYIAPLSTRRGLSIW